jgi:hypothetical protein
MRNGGFTAVAMLTRMLSPALALLIRSSAFRVERCMTMGLGRPLRPLPLPQEVPMRRTAAALSISAALALTACATRPQPQGFMGALSPQAPIVSLGAGDALGKAVYVNDLILAATALDASTTYTNVDAGTTERLVGE